MCIRDSAYAEVAHERGGRVVLGGQRVARAQRHLSAGGRERAHEVRRLGGHVHAGAYAHARKRLLALEALADGREHGHVAVGPQDAGKALVGQRDVFDVVVLGHGKASLGMENGTVRPLLYASAHAFTSGLSSTTSSGATSPGFSIA